MIGMQQVFQGLGEQDYDTVNALIAPADDPPAGLVFHLSGPIDGGWRVIDVWSSRADFDAFASRVGAAVASSGVEMSAPPEVTEFAVHETFPA
jgi:hypothetical protein